MNVNRIEQCAEYRQKLPLFENERPPCSPIYVRSKYLQLPPGTIKPSKVDTPSRQITWIAIYDQTLKHTY